MIRLPSRFANFVFGSYLVLGALLLYLIRYGAFQSVFISVLAAAVASFLIVRGATLIAKKKARQERKKLEGEVARQSQSVREEKERLELALSALEAGVVTIDRDMKFIFWNMAAEKFLEWKILPKPGDLATAWIRVSGLVEMIQETRVSQKPVSKEVPIFRDGKEFTYAAHTRPCTLPDGSGVLLILQDRTAIRHLERARQDFVVNASHELKTPLTAIKGYLDTLLDGAGEDPTTRKQFLTQLSKNVNRLDSLARDLLSLTRIETRNENLIKTPVNLAELAKQTIERQAATAQKKELAVSLETPEAISAITHRNSVEQILENLLDNAIKYTPQTGKIRMEIRQEGTRAVISVEDNGVGIPKGDLDRIFERFYRVDKARSIDEGGTGLGLSIVKHLVSQLNGSVKVESDLGHGSRFTVSIPSSL